MARIELRNCTVRIKDGLSGAGLVNQPSVAPAQDDTSLTIDSVVLNTLTPAKVPVGARFRIAGETVPVDHVVTGRTQGTDAGVDEQQTVTLTTCTTTFTLSFNGKVTTAIAHDADNATVKAAIVALDDGYGTGDFAVSGSAGGPYVVTFQGALANMPQSAMIGTADTGSIAIVRTVHGAAPTPTTTTTAITFSPALGAGSYADDGALTFKSQQIDIKIGEGDMKYAEGNQYKYDLDRGLLDTVRNGDDVPMDVSMNFTFEHVKTGTAEVITPIDAVKGENGASEWVSSSPDACEPYAVNVEIENDPPCNQSFRETWVFPDFRSEKRDYDYKNATIAISGKCNAKEPIITRG